MKLRFLQLFVFIAGCLGLFFICFPDCLTVFNQKECERLHFRTSEYIQKTNHPIQVDTMRAIIGQDSSILAI
ncbi:hypothetical protein KUV50_08410 [Membranicola marinus]|uniref:Uncharacterized protein n=1 Tax=Membranihabitans marinus TaxID=1227546 RepID=A0A953HP16_9BACT|nr:hypothetical protein [Membranihabitans marinus]MBY5958148.1 hypothetical protein [Membranihabitans marinus]